MLTLSLYMVISAFIYLVSTQKRASHFTELNKLWQVFCLCKAGYLGTKFLVGVQRLLQLISCTGREREVDQIICVPQGR